MKKLIFWLALLPMVFFVYSVEAVNSFRTMNYQGRLTDLAGNPVADGQYVITFRLYDDPNALLGNSKWSETETNVQTKNGYFNTSLGSINPFYAKELNFNNQYWLGIQVGSDSEMSPRQALNSVPAALNSDVPIGTILAWHKSLAANPTVVLPAQWVECNGQPIADNESPYNGQTVPNLNGAVSGANSPGFSSAEKLFLRGSTTSGQGEEDAFQGHFHTPNSGQFVDFVGSGGSNTLSVGTQFSTFSTSGGPATDGAHGAPRVSSETRPKSMAVVWIMKIK